MLLRSLIIKVIKSLINDHQSGNLTAPPPPPTPPAHYEAGPTSLRNLCCRLPPVTWACYIQCINSTNISLGMEFLKRWLSKQIQHLWSWSWYDIADHNDHPNLIIQITLYNNLIMYWHCIERWNRVSEGNTSKSRPGEIKIPSEMEVAPRYNCWHCWHCWHCSTLLTWRIMSNHFIHICLVPICQ